MQTNNYHRWIKSFLNCHSKKKKMITMEHWKYYDNNQIFTNESNLAIE